MRPPIPQGSSPRRHERGESGRLSTGAAVAVTRRTSRTRDTAWPWVAALAAAACVGWLPFVGRALSPDEGGFLVVAAQWSPGSSLYGDYWVDRPPGLVALFTLAGGPGGLRALGLVAVVLTVVLAGVLGRAATPGPRVAVLLPAATAAIFVATPLFGGTVVNGELLGLPFVLAGMAASLVALRSTRAASTTGWAMLAGAAGAAAVLVKQNLLDVPVLVLALAVAAHRGGAGLVARRTLARLVVGVATGAGLLTALVLFGAALRGTGPVDLFRAVVLFRGEASRVITRSASGSTAFRLGGLALALVGSGAPLLAVLFARAVRSGPPATTGAGRTRLDLRWPAATVLAWESVAALLGGSYWLHYLMGLVPGLVLLAAAAAQRPGGVRRPQLGALGLAAASTLCVVGWVVVHPIERPEAPVIEYLADHARPGDTAVVGFGAPNILQATGLDSPYPYLWSLPVRVRDPELRELATVLAGPARPTWVVLSGRSLTTWGVDASGADPLVRAHYDLATRAGRFTVYHRNDVG